MLMFQSARPFPNPDRRYPGENGGSTAQNVTFFKLSWYIESGLPSVTLSNFFTSLASSTSWIICLKTCDHFYLQYLIHSKVLLMATLYNNNIFMQGSIDPFYLPFVKLTFWQFRWLMEYRKINSYSNSSSKEIHSQHDTYELPL